MNKGFKIISALVSAILLTSTVFAGGGGSSKKPLEGTYPIALSHGFLGWGEDGNTNGLLDPFNYWGGMDGYLRSEGAKVFVASKNPVDSNEVRAAQFKSKLLYYMAANGESKVHILGHSQGAVDSRYMISNLGMSNKVATWTSLNGANRGTVVADIGSALLPDWIVNSLDTILNFLTGLFYGTEQDLKASMSSLAVGTMNTFNQYTPDHPGVKYYSYGSKIYPVPTHLFAIMQPIVALGSATVGQSGSNDGLISLSSQQWGTWKGGPSLPWYIEGVDHLQASNTFGYGELLYDVEGYFLKMAKNMKNNQ